ncbi:hypothetical protein KAI46_12790, partial [bacterium]|nr:hypothetical protein [bacterium]
ATASTFEYELAEGTEPATPATGTIDCRQAPAGWERSFVSGDGYRAAFKSLAVDATGMTLYIDDTNNQGTRRTGVKGYESMTDIDTGINPFPYSAADDQWYWWYKSLDETTPLRWAVIADDRFVYIWWNRDSATNSTYGRLNAFGDFNSYLSADVWNFIVTGETSVTDERFQSMLVTSPKPYTPGAALLDSGVSLARDLQGIGAGLASGAAFVMQSSIDDHYCIPAGYSGVSFPSWVTGGAIISPIDLIEVFGGTNLLRGRCPGLYSPFHDRPYSGIESEIVQGVGDYADTCFLSLPMAGGVQGGGNSFYVRYGQVLINIVGPWRD